MKKVTQVTTQEGCTICGRVKWGQVQPLPFSKWRHGECGLGSREWEAYYHGLPPIEREPLRPFFELVYPQQGESNHVTR